MISYNSSEVVQCLRQYDMFANSLNLVKSKEEREMIVKQLTKLEEKIISLTNEMYEEEYYTLANKECGLLDEEKNRVTMLIDLINQRLSYVEKRCNNHYQLTGESIDVSNVLGADLLDDLENRVRIIEKYSKNVKLEKELDEEVKSLTNKISLASEKIDINKSLNVELEVTFKKVLDEAFNKLNLYDLLEEKNDIEYAYNETENLLTLARLNLETAKTSPINILSDCEKMFKEVSEDYIKYKDKMNTLRLIELYDDNVDNYQELLDKRKEVNEILKYIKNEDLLSLISDTINKQYNTILMEEQDINTLNDLVLEKNRKIDVIAEIKEENNSEEFQSVLKVLIENERKKQEKILEEQRKIEEEEKQRRLEIERKRQEEILKRQRIIEEARKKEMEKRTKQMLEEQQKSVLQGKKQDKNVSFETMKDISNEKDVEKEEKVKEERITREEARKDNYILDLNAYKDEEIETNKEENENLTFFKNKVDIEKELFEEFNNKSVEDKREEVSADNTKHEAVEEQPILEKEDVKDYKEEQTFFDRIGEKVTDNKLPDMSIDEYMRNFDENKIDKNETISDFEDAFPSIPM